jgi:amidase
MVRGLLAPRGMKSLTLFTFGLTIACGAAALRAETHRHVPAAYSGSLTSAQPPVLRIKSGDRVITATLDDTGGDAQGAKRASAPNPLTGPFFVEGAAPGDLLVVTIEKLTPNRSIGQSSSTMIANSIDPGSITSKPDATRFPWTIDVEHGVVRLDLHAVSKSTDWKARFSTPEFALPLEPSLAAIGVAPASTDAAVSTTSGAFGGNMMAAAVTPGARVMLRVFQPGALLFLGHGLARQGDGAVTGTGIETSLDVEFSVEVVKKKEWPHSSVTRPSTVVGEFEQGWPRIETADSVMTVGSASSLLEAVQHATIELHHWLDDDFGLSEKTVSILIGQSMEYEIGSLAGPNFTVVAKVRKAYLPKPAAGL